MGGVGAFRRGWRGSFPPRHGLGGARGFVWGVRRRRRLQGVTVPCAVARWTRPMRETAVWGEVFVQAAVVLLYPRADVTLRLRGQYGVPEA